MSDPCKTHKSQTARYIDWIVKIDKGLEQRQCPTCLRWYFHGEFGKGWAKGLKQKDMIHNVFNP